MLGVQNMEHDECERVECSYDELSKCVKKPKIQKNYNIEPILPKQ